MSVVSARPSPPRLRNHNFSRKLSHNNQQRRQGQHDLALRSSNQTNICNHAETDHQVSRNSMHRSQSEPFVLDLGAAGVGRGSGATDPPEDVERRPRSSSTRLRRSLSGRLGNRTTKSAQKPGKIVVEDVDAQNGEDGINIADHGGESHDPRLERRKSRLSTSLSRLSRNSWISPSRSPSSARKPLGGGPADDLNPTLQHRKSGIIVSEEESQVNCSRPSRSTNEPQGTHPGRWAGRDTERLSASVNVETHDSESSPLPPVPKLPSITRSSSPSSSYASSELPPTMPKSMSFERLQSNGVEKSRKRDELWSAFRTLDSEFHK